MHEGEQQSSDDRHGAEWTAVMWMSPGARIVIAQRGSEHHRNDAVRIVTEDTEYTDQTLRQRTNRAMHNRHCHPGTPFQTKKHSVYIRVNASV